MNGGLYVGTRLRTAKAPPISRCMGQAIDPRLDSLLLDDVRAGHPRVPVTSDRGWSQRELPPEIRRNQKSATRLTTMS